MTDNFPINLQKEDEDLRNEDHIFGVFSTPKTDTSVIDIIYDRYTPVEPRERNTKRYTFDLPATATNIFSKFHEIWYNITMKLEKL